MIDVEITMYQIQYFHDIINMECVSNDTKEGGHLREEHALSIAIDAVRIFTSKLNLKYHK